MKLSDIIANRILEMIDSQNGIAELQRNELAEEFGCVPSQINYVISSRFTPEQGYIVESRRGGGGYVKITKINLGRSEMLAHIINRLGDKLDYYNGKLILSNLYYEGLISKKSADIIMAALTDSCYKGVAAETRDRIRASILKQMLLRILCH